MIRGAQSAGGGSPGEPIYGMDALGGAAFNLMWPTYYGNAWPYLNVLHQGPWYSPSYYALPAPQRPASGWPTGVGPSTTVEFPICFGLDANNGFFPPGDYKARTSSGWTLQFTNCINVGSISAPAVNVATCTVADLGAAGVYQTTLKISATSPAGAGTYTLDDLQVYKKNGTFAASEALLDAGELFDPGFLASMAGVKAVRTKDWMQIDGLTRRVTQYSELVQESSRSWQADGHGSNVPYSVCAKLAKKLDCALFFSGSLLDCSTMFTASAATDRISVAGNDPGSGNPYAFEFADGDEFVVNDYGTGAGAPAGLSILTRYFARDVIAGVSMKAALTSGGAAIDITADYGLTGALISKLFTSAQYQSLYNSIIAELYAAAPNLTIIPDVGNENWNTAAAYGYHQCRDVVSIRANIENGSGGGNASTGYGWAMHRMWTACDAYYPREQVVRMISGQWSYFNGIGAVYNYSSASYYGAQTIGNLIDAHCCAGYVHPALNGGYPPPPALGNFDLSPELLAGANWYSSIAYVIGDRVHKTNGTNYRCILGHTNQVPPNATYWAAEASNGLVGNATSWTDAQWLEAYTYGNTVWATLLASYKSQADALRTNPVPAGFVTYECGPLNVLDGFNVPGQGAMSVRYKAWTLTTSFRSFLQDMVARVFEDNGIKLITYYIDAGHWSSGDGGGGTTQSVTYGIKRGSQLPDTPGSTYFRGISI